MSSSELTRLTAESLYLVLLVSAPVLLASLAVGLFVGVLQAVTQVHEQSLAFVPKLVAVGLALALGGAWMGGELVQFTQRIFTALPSLVH